CTSMIGSYTALFTVPVWMPFHRVAATTGALPLYRGSHTEGVRELELADNPSGWQTRLAAHELPDIGDLDAGDVLVFTTMTVHGGSVNACNSYRVSMDVRFQPVTDPICESALTLPGYPHTWEEICEDWDSEFARYWERLDLNVVPFDDRWERWREAEALTRGRAQDAAALSALRIVASQSASVEVRAEARRLLDNLDPLAGLNG
ncbi:phytanoyl-CoA dioxygenase family protein, partial [Lentzea alba]|uniref:phytanoyl-CoA dioxygenase family protein n=1 Tax=Lentzea alba TaxID=2714351 RepID=UPI0039BFE2A5